MLMVLAFFSSLFSVSSPLIYHFCYTILFCLYYIFICGLRNTLVGMLALRSDFVSTIMVPLPTCLFHHLRHIRVKLHIPSLLLFSFASPSLLSVSLPPCLPLNSFTFVLDHDQLIVFISLMIYWPANFLQFARMVPRKFMPT